MEIEGKHYVSGDAILKQTVDPEPGYAVKEVFLPRKERMYMPFCLRIRKYHQVEGYPFYRQDQNFLAGIREEG